MGKMYRERSNDFGNTICQVLEMHANSNCGANRKAR